MTKVRVRVNDAIAKYGGALADSSQPEGYPRLIGAQPVEVVLTSQVSLWLARGELVAVMSDEPDPVVVEPPVDRRRVDWPKALREDLKGLLTRLGLTPEQVSAMTLEELVALPGIGEAKAKAILKAFGND